MVKKFFAKLAKLVDKFEGQLTHKAYLRLLERADSTAGAYLPTRERYVACAGSKPMYRGFPCAKWQMWHLLTLQAYRSEDEYAVKKVMKAMRGYVSNFFTCQTCREHFTKDTRNLDSVFGL